MAPRAGWCPGWSGGPGNGPGRSQGVPMLPEVSPRALLTGQPLGKRPEAETNVRPKWLLNAPRRPRFRALGTAMSPRGPVNAGVGPAPGYGSAPPHLGNRDHSEDQNRSPKWRARRPDPNPPARVPRTATCQGQFTSEVHAAPRSDPTSAPQINRIRSSVASGRTP
jgi:hypothetical protein